ncbi:hypothetical protein KIN20_032306 [Parelaphostrongylus tenuis]|uniref:Uncharacterized protein n=1 Tax=Parelaphostrongylus tenuis TaxID=148309 RepID=A0AAD5R6V2_PARTN|nr:hypothetical protein KIN20_032306 [Parelaphostrongylus tenuis]
MSFKIDVYCAVWVPANSECCSLPEPNMAIESKVQDEKPESAPILMMTYLSNCMNNIKSTLNTNGVPVGLDANGRAVSVCCSNNL